MFNNAPRHHGQDPFERGTLATTSLVAAGVTVVVDTLPEAVALSALGIIGLFVTVNVLNAVAWVLGAVTALACRHARVLGPTTATPDCA